MEAVWNGPRRTISISLLLHPIAWLIGTFEVWVIMSFMGRQISIDNAAILESLGTSISMAAFFISGGRGIQEGGYVLLGRMLGLPAHVGLALSLIKRVPDWTLGIPGFIVWQGTRDASFMVERGGLVIAGRDRAGVTERIVLDDGIATRTIAPGPNSTPRTPQPR